MTMGKAKGLPVRNKMHQAAISLACMAALGAVSLLLTSCSSNTLTPTVSPDVSALAPYQTTETARVTGQTDSYTGETLPNPNQTQPKYGLNETDIGTMWPDQSGNMLFAFGDNFNTSSTSCAVRTNWSSNGLAKSTDKALNGGLHFSSVLSSNGQMTEIIHKEGLDVTEIPTAGINVGSRQYINFQAIKQFNVNNDADQWTDWYSEIAYSDDGGTTWTKSGTIWGGGSNFNQVAYLKGSGTTVYVFGTPSGRHGSVHLAKVDSGSLLNYGAYQYWTGTGWVAGNDSAAVAITQGGAGEMSVIYNTYFNRYIMAYLSVDRRAIVMRDASDPTGDWSNEKVLLEDSGNGIYAPMMHPWFTSGADVNFLVSQAVGIQQPSCNNNFVTNIFLYHSNLQGTTFNLVSNPGFEDFPGAALNYKSHWTGSGFLTSDSHSGQSAAELDNFVGGQFQDDVAQNVAVKPNTNYTLTAWVKINLPNYPAVYFGVRGAGGIQQIQPSVSSNGWTQLTLKFNSGADTQEQVFFGTFGSYGLVLKADDFQLAPTQ